jgi:hypothetical protein
LAERYNQDQETIDYHYAMLACIIANAHRDPKKKAFKIKDFMPRRGKEAQRHKPGPVTLEQLKTINQALGGEEK